MSIRKHLAEQSREPRNRKLSPDEARIVWDRLQAGESIAQVHRDYAHRVSSTTIKRIASGERMVS